MRFASTIVSDNQGKRVRRFVRKLVGQDLGKTYGINTLGFFIYAKIVLPMKNKVLSNFSRFCRGVKPIRLHRAFKVKIFFESDNVSNLH